MNAVVPLTETPNALAPLTAKDLHARVQLIQKAMKAVMKDKVHYGIVPGTPKPSLWKAGAEVLCAMFHIAPSYRIEDLSDHDCIRYRIACVGTHQISGAVLGEGMGECSSNEKKYKWRQVKSAREYDNTDESRRRIEFGYDREKREEYEILQVRQEPADIANTVLKMACKRAQVAMVINVTAASDIFAQDLEDLPEGYLDEHGLSSGNGGRSPSGNGRSTKPQTNPPQARSNGGASGPKKATEKQVALLFRRLEENSVPAAQFNEHFGIKEVADLPIDKVDLALKWISSAHSDQGGEGEDEAGVRG